MAPINDIEISWRWQSGAQQVWERIWLRTGQRKTSTARKYSTLATLGRYQSPEVDFEARTVFMRTFVSF